MEKEEIAKVVRKHRHEKAAILAILHELQEHDRCVDMESLRYVSELLKVPFAYAYGITTFYGAFSTAKKGKTQIKVCDGISCHMKGSRDIIDTIRSHLNIDVGETTWNEKFSLDKVACLGLCAVGPNLSLNGKAFSMVTRGQVKDLLEKIQGGKK